MRRIHQVTNVAVLVAGLAPVARAGAGGAELKLTVRPEGLVSLIPREAIFYLERRGHEAIREAFLASNLGKMAQDEAIQGLVHGSRVEFGRFIVKQMFSLQDPEAIDRHQKLLHELLKPFWYNPAAMYVIVPEKMPEEAPGMGFICAVGEKYRRDCATALEALMKVGVPPAGQAGTRQAFTHKTGKIAWEAVAKDHRAFTLPKDPDERLGALKDRQLFLASWQVRPLLLVATSLPAAKAMESVLANPAESKQSDAGVKAVMAKTALKDWAFRWHLDAASAYTKFRKAVVEDDPQAVRPMQALGLDKIRALGGTGGYADKVFVRLTYLDAPQADRGIVKLFQAGGSYQRGFAMTPPDAVFCLGGQLDTKAVLRMIRDLLLVDAGPAEGGNETAPAPKLTDGQAKIMEQLEALAEASAGHAGVFVTDIQAIMTGMYAGGMPVGGVLDLKDRDKAAKAVEALADLIGPPPEPAPPPPPGAPPRPGRARPEPPPRPKEYRGVPIRYAGRMVRFAVLKDRVVMALGPNPMKAAIDSALDKIGGFEPDSRGDRLLKLAGDGSFAFKMDLATLARLGWPFLVQLSERSEGEFPLANLPSTGKMVRLLGPEVAVFQPDAGGLLLKSRGLVPFATKAPFLMQFAGVLVMGLM